MTLEQLEQYAYKHGVTVDDIFELMINPAISCCIDDNCYIALSKDLTREQRLEYLAHELGHCMRGAFYSPLVPMFTRGLCEHKAKVWAVHKLLPFYRLKKAFAEGYSEYWDLAEYLNVSENMIKDALEIYKEEGKITE